MHPLTSLWEGLYSEYHGCLMLRTIFISLLLIAIRLHAESRVYVALWFDTEDYIDPAADDAALRIANDLTKMGFEPHSKSWVKRRAFSKVVADAT
jgi:hypothetical protein